MELRSRVKGRCLYGRIDSQVFEPCDVGFAPLHCV